MSPLACCIVGGLRDTGRFLRGFSSFLLISLVCRKKHWHAWLPVHNPVLRLEWQRLDVCNLKFFYQAVVGHRSVSSGVMYVGNTFTHADWVRKLKNIWTTDNTRFWNCSLWCCARIHHALLHQHQCSWSTWWILPIPPFHWSHLKASHHLNGWAAVSVRLHQEILCRSKPHLLQTAWDVGKPGNILQG